MTKLEDITKDLINDVVQIMDPEARTLTQIDPSQREEIELLIEAHIEIVKERLIG